MATDDSADPAFMPRVLLRHLIHCRQRPCVLGAGIACPRPNAMRIWYFCDPPLPDDQETRPDSYTPGHGVVVYFSQRETNTSYTVQGQGEARFQCTAGATECRISCSCNDPGPHDWLLDVFCAKYRAVWYPADDNE